MQDFILLVLHLPPVVSAHGPALDRLLFYVHLLMFALFIGWGAFFLYTIWRYRQRKNPTADPVGVRGHLSSYLEVGVAGVEALLLIGFAIPIWARGASFGNFPKESEATVVRVIGRQFNWIARYAGADGVFGKGDARFVTQANPLGMDPEDASGKDDIIIQTSEVTVPVGKPVIAHISSLDVIHGFTVKPLRISQDAIPGLSNPVWFTPTETGNYLITCSQLCGNGHSSMRGLLRVVSSEDYDAFLKTQAPKAGEAVSYE
jgi:cytochrome c oxidase subunit 2